MKNVLVFAYYFPPLGLSGVQRTLAFVKYLPLYGWNPTVITVGDIAYYAHDTELLKELEECNIDVYRTQSLDPHALAGKGTFAMPSEAKRKVLSFLSDTFLFPDSKIGWKKYAKRMAHKVVSEKSFDAVFSTAPPYTSLILASEISSEYAIPLFLDYRDAWVDYPFKRYVTPFHKLRHIKSENAVLKKARGVIVASESIYHAMEKRYGEIVKSKTRIITQGYDPFYFSEEAVNTSEKKKMIITYSGIFYEDRTPEYFFKAVRLLIDNLPQIKDELELWFLGVFRDEHRYLIHHLGLDDIVKVMGYVDHKRCVDLLKQSDVLWAMMMDDCSTPGKIFEYIGANKHILGCVPTDGNMARIIRACNGTVVEPDNIQEIEKALNNLYSLHQKQSLPKPKEEIRTLYDRKLLTKTLADFMNTKIQN